MSSEPKGFSVLKRVSLTGQAVAALRQGIADGIWREFLPGERRLCELFQVSRPTVRTALQQLAAEGLIEIRQGLRNRIVPRGPRARAPGKRLIVIVACRPLSMIAMNIYHGISVMRTSLAKRGIETEILVCPMRDGQAQRRKLERFLSPSRVACYVLLAASRELQQWCVGHAIPALVLGSCHASVRLPSLDVDFRAVCRHAGGIFLNKGHRRLALVIGDARQGQGGAGSLASEQGFLEAVRQHRAADNARAVIVRHNGSAQDINAKLDALFASPRPPTALLVARMPYVLFVIVYLLKRGISIPDQVSIIARDQDSIFPDFSPPIAHYHFNGEMFNGWLTRLMLQMVGRGQLSAKPNLIFPRFFAGGSIRDLT